MAPFDEKLVSDRIKELVIGQFSYIYGVRVERTAKDRYSIEHIVGAKFDTAMTYMRVFYGKWHRESKLGPRVRANKRKRSRRS